MTRRGSGTSADQWMDNLDSWSFLSISMSCSIGTLWAQIAPPVIGLYRMLFE